MEMLTSTRQAALKNTDHWTLEYITVQRAQPLIEALDGDMSSFVTIAEVNAFTAARPSHWRLVYRLSTHHDIY